MPYTKLCSDRFARIEVGVKLNFHQIRIAMEKPLLKWTPVPTVYPKKYAHGFVVLCFVVVMQSFIMDSHEVFIHIHQSCFAGTGAIVRFPHCQWSKPGGYGKISQCITTTKHSKAKTVCIFIGIYCNDNEHDKAWRVCIYVRMYFTAYDIIFSQTQIVAYLHLTCDG